MTGAATEPLPRGLRFADDQEPGITRVRRGRGFTYRGPDGATVTGTGERERIAALAVPPAWTDVWIAPDPDAHLQATGRDAKGRKQYRYHARYRAQRDDMKFERLPEFGEALGPLRKQVATDIRRRGLDHDTVVATVVHLLERTLIRVGNDEYARQNGSYGLTTLRSPQVVVEGSEVRFVFTGKSGKDHEIDVEDRLAARTVRRCQELPGQRLFRYRCPDGTLRPVGSADVNEYLRRVTGGDFTAKDFRTWMATLMAAVALAGLELPESERATARTVKTVMQVVGSRLGNTATVARASYVHPRVVAAYEDGTLGPTWQRLRARDRRWLTGEEATLVRFLRSRPRRPRS